MSTKNRTGQVRCGTKGLGRTNPVRGQFRVSSDFFYDQIYSYLQTGIKNEFVWFYSNQEAKKLPYIDEILIMEFEEFIVGAVNEKRSEKEYTSKDSLKLELQPLTAGRLTCIIK
jgi:hypothetical protein